MAVIGKIRSYSKLLIIIVGLALAAFVLGDFFRKGPKRGSVEFAEISGEKISYNDFEARVNQYTEMKKQQTGQETFSADQIFQFREEVWQTIERETIMKKEYDALGLIVTKDELFDLVQGKNPHQMIVQNFTDPQTGQFNPATVLQFLKQLEQRDEKTKQQWADLEQAIKADRLQTKYFDLIRNGYYMPKAFAKRDYEAKNKVAKFRFLALKFASISDSTITVTKEEIQKYYDDHKYEYDQEASRDLEYVVFDVLPSDADSKKTLEEFTKLKAEFSTSDDIPTFVNSAVNSDVPYDSSFFKKGLLAISIDTFAFMPKAAKNDVFGPFFENGAYKMARIMDIQARPDSMKAKHILIAYKGAMRADPKVVITKEKAKSTADSLLAILKKDPKKFDEIAKTRSDDPTAATKAGDLGWFADGAMVKAFNDACLTGKVGDRKVIETDFGYHVIEVTGKKEPVKKVRIAVLVRNLEPSKETTQGVYAKASAFAGENTTIEMFDKSVADKGLNKRLAERMREMDPNIPGLQSPRDLIRWAYDENTQKGNVSKVFEYENQFVIATLKDIREKGIASFEQKKKELEPLAKREKKAEMLTKKINTAKSAGISIEQLASKLSVPADTLDFITFSAYSLPGFGPEPEVLGTLFTLKPNAMSEPIKGKSGMFVVNVDSFVEAPATKDYSSTLKQTMGYFGQRVSRDIFNALQKNAKIVDNRGKFY